MRVVQLIRAVVPATRAPEAALDAWPALTAWGNAVRRAGAEPVVVVAAEQPAHIRRNDVSCHFVQVTGTDGPARLARVARDLKPDVVHIPGLSSSAYAAAVARDLPGTPIVMQDRKDRVPRAWRRQRMRRELRAVDGVVFTALDQAQPFLRARLFPAHCTVFLSASNTSPFEPLDRADARALTGLHGAPCMLWIGRLVGVKDPLAAIRVFRIVLDAEPGAHLFMCYTDDALLPAVRARCDSDPLLRQHVHLLGALPHAQIRGLLSAADVYLSTSREEGGSFAFIEAMSCGIPSVVPDIPGFRGLAGSRAGAFYPPGDADAAARAIVDMYRHAPSRAEIRAHFEQHASMIAVGRGLIDIYRTVMRRRTQKRVVMIVPGGVDPSGTERVIPHLLSLIGRISRHVDLHVIALRQATPHSSYSLRGATIHSVSGLRALQHMRALHRSRSLSALHAIWMHPSGTLAAVASALTGVPMLLHVNGGDLAAVPQAQFGGQRTLGGRIRLRIAAAQAREVTVPSAEMREVAARIGITARRVTYGIALDEWTVTPPQPRPPGRIRLLHVGYTSAVKDHATLLRAAALLVRDGVDFYLEVVAGRGSDALVGPRDDLGLRDHVKITGFVPHAQLRRHFDAAHVLVVSSLYEGDPIVALEAAVAGLAVVGTAVGHLREWAPDAGLIVPPGDADALAGVIRRVIDDDALRFRLACNAQQHALHHDVDAAAADILAFYGVDTRGHNGT